VLRLSAVYYLGLGALSCGQEYCNKINQISTENYIAIFLFAPTFCEFLSLAILQSAQNKTFRLLAVIGSALSVNFKATDVIIANVLDKCFYNFCMILKNFHKIEIGGFTKS